ncbi:MAG: glycosyltransferase family 2 protein [Solirubrobacterales bacterium]
MSDDEGQPITGPPRTSMFRAPATSSPTLEGSRTAPAAQPVADGSLVQERPSLGSLQAIRHGRVAAMRAAIDFVGACAAIAAVVIENGSPAWPAIPLAPLFLVGVSQVLGLYGSTGSVVSRTAGFQGRSLKGRLVTTALFAWTASLLIASHGPGLGVIGQLALWALALALGCVGAMAAAPIARRIEHVERWLVVGDAETAERLNAYEPLRAHARIVHTVPPPAPSATPAADREGALRMVDEHRADRVVIAAQSLDDKGLVSMIKTFRSLGVPVSLLPHPLDLLEAPATEPVRLGGVPLIQVKSLATRGRPPYRGPDRRLDRRTRVSVVIPALNEADNIAHVLERFPPDLHEVILVDGNSRDRTVEVAREARPDIRVVLQPGIGKGDALRAGFAAVTGNLVVMIDADGSADPAEIPRFVAALEAGADFAKGSRFLPGGGSADITRLRRVGNYGLSGFVNLLYRTHFTDLCYGYNAFWARCLPFISLDVAGFEVETLINLRLANAGMRISEVPSYEALRLSGQTNLKTFRDGFRVLFTILGEWGHQHSPAHRGGWRPRSADHAVTGRGPATARSF